jgi:predicted CoA-binding protein
MKYKNVNFKENSEYIIWYLQESDSWESVNSITCALSNYNGITENVIRQNLRKFKTVNLVNIKPIPKKNIQDKKLYQIDYHVLQDYLSEKEESGLGSELYKPISDDSETIDEIKESVEDLILENNRKNTDINQLLNKVEAQQSLVNSQQKNIEKLQSEVEKMKKFQHEVKQQMQQQ